MAKQITSQGTVYETGRADTEKLFDEESLAHAGGPVGWANSTAIEAEDQIATYGSTEAAYHAYSSNVEETLNEWGFDLGTERGRKVLGESMNAFDKKFYALTGFDFYGVFGDEEKQ